MNSELRVQSLKWWSFHESNERDERAEEIERLREENIALREALASKEKDQVTSRTVTTGT